MKTIISVYLILVVSLSADNLFDNGTMDTAGGWKGSRKIIKDEEAAAHPAPPAANGKSVKQEEPRVLLVSAKKRDIVSFSQEIETRGLTDIIITFRYRTKDYIGRGLELRGVRRDRNSTYTNRPVVADGRWHEVEWHYNQVFGSSEIDFIFAVLEGKGDICFDDITARPK